MHMLKCPGGDTRMRKYVIRKYALRNRATDGGTGPGRGGLGWGETRNEHSAGAASEEGKACRKENDFFFARAVFGMEHADVVLLQGPGLRFRA